MKTLEAVKKISISKENLTRAESAEVFDEIMSGVVPEAITASFLVAQNMKGVSIEELVGAAMAIRKKAAFINTSAHPAIDTCGTGGDGADTFNISTTAAFVASGAGAYVAKHGGRSVSSKCGSADVLSELGVNIDAHPTVMEHCLQENGIAFLFAQKMHPAFKYATPVRKLLGFRTIFNMLGPLVNPAGAKGQLLGVFDAKLTETFAQALQRLGSSRALVVHSADGLDEIGVSAPTRISELRGGEIKTYEFRPETIIGKTGDNSEIKGGNARENAKRLRLILENKDFSSARDIVLLNASGAIISAGLADDFKSAYALAENSLSSGKALEKLEKLIEFSNAK